MTKNYVIGALITGLAASWGTEEVPGRSYNSANSFAQGERLIPEDEVFFITYKVVDH